MVHKSEIDFAKSQARIARASLVRLKHRLDANQELWRTEEDFEARMDAAIEAGDRKILDAAEVLRYVDES